MCCVRSWSSCWHLVWRALGPRAWLGIREHPHCTQFVCASLFAQSIISVVHGYTRKTKSLAHACFLARAHIQVRAVHAGGAGAADGTHASNSGSSLTHWPSHLWRYRLRGADSDSDGFGCEQGGRGGGGSSGVCWGTHGGGGWRRGDSVPASPSCCIYHICAPHSKEGGVFVRAFVHDCLGVHRGSVSG